jgi:hypothetical protein
MIKLRPGVDTTSTTNLNDNTEYSSSNLIRFLYERDGLGLIQKMGGWVNYFGSALSSKIRALKGWADLNAQNHLAIGAESSLNVLTNGTLVNITPQTTRTNTAPDFSTTSGSNLVTIIDSNIVASVLDYVVFETPVSVGGLILTGPYLIYTAASTTYTIQASSNATSTVSSGGASYAFSTTNGSSVITCTFNNHGYSAGDEIYVSASTTVGGVTLSGLYSILTVPTANSFTFAAQNTATSTAGPTAINGGSIESLFYIAIGPQPASTGFGVGGFGVGGFGSGTAQPSVSGTAITATNWTLDNFGQDLVACPTGGAIYYWQPDGQLQNAQIVGGNSPTVNNGIFVAMPERQIIAYGSSFTLAPDPLLVRWSDIEDFTQWEGSVTNQAGSYRIPTGSKIVTGIQGPQQGLLWTDLDLWAMQYVGPPFVYGFNKIGTNCGAISNKCVGTLNGAVYWMSQKQFFMSMGAGPQSIPCTVWDAVFQNLKSGVDNNGLPYTDRICCAVNSQFNEVMWFYPSANGNGENDSYVKYNIVMNCWDYGTLGRTAWIDQSVLGPPIGAGSDNWLYQHEIGNDAYVGNQATAMLSNAGSGYFVLDEGADNLVFVDQIWPDMKWGTYSGNPNATVNITFNATNYPGDTPIVYGPYAMTQQTQYLSVRIRARLMQIVISSDDVGTFWRLGGIRYRFQPDGRF